MEIKVLEQEFVICKLDSLDEISVHDEFCFISKTDEEISLICTQRYTPSKTLELQKNYKGLRIEGTLDFNFIGVITKILALLSLNEISVNVVRTYNTNYIFVKNNKLNKTIEILSANNYSII